MTPHAYAVYFYSPFTKDYEWSLVSRDLDQCEKRFRERKEKGIIVKTRPNGVYIKPNLPLSDIKKFYQVVEERWN